MRERQYNFNFHSVSNLLTSFFLKLSFPLRIFVSTTIFLFSIYSYLSFFLSYLSISIFLSISLSTSFSYSRPRIWWAGRAGVSPRKFDRILKCHHRQAKGNKSLSELTYLSIVLFGLLPYVLSIFLFLGSGPKGADDLCFHIGGNFSSSSSVPPCLNPGLEAQIPVLRLNS